MNTGGEVKNDTLKVIFRNSREIAYAQLPESVTAAIQRITEDHPRTVNITITINRVADPDALFDELSKVKIKRGVS